MPSAIIYNLVPVIPPLLDYLMPLNESRRKIIYVKAEYPFDSNLYHYELWIFYDILVFAHVILILSTDSTYTTFLHHNLGLFAVTQ